MRNATRAKKQDHPRCHVCNTKIDKAAGDIHPACDDTTEARWIRAQHTAWLRKLCSR